MKVSEKADKELKKLFALPENAGKQLRIVIAGFGWGGPRFGIALDEQKNENDTVVKQEGYSFVFERRLTGFLEDAWVDYKKNWFGEASFVVNLGEGCC